MHETAPKPDLYNYRLDLQEIFPNAQNDVLRYVDKYLQSFVTTLKQLNPEYSIDLTRSALLRFLCKDDTRGQNAFQTITDVQQRFADILSSFPDLRDNKVFQELGDVGSNDLDIKVWKNRPNLEYSLLSDNDKEQEESTKLQIGNTFMASAAALGSSVDNTVIYDEATQTYHSTIELVSDSPNERLFVTAVYGPKSTNLLVKGGQLLFRRQKPDGSTISEFQLDMGFYSMPHFDMRSGPLASNKQQLAVPLSVVNGSLGLDLSTDRIQDLNATIYGPDSFNIERVIDRSNLPAEVERALRAVRYSLLFNNLDSDGKTVRRWKNKLFTKTAWERLRSIFTETARALKDGSFQFVDYNRHMLVKEVLVMLEIDPHLFLMVAAEINLFSIFPEWEGVSAGEIKSMIANSPSLQLPVDGTLRGLKAPSVWQSRMVYKHTPFRQRPSALSMFANAHMGNVRPPHPLNRTEINHLYATTPGDSEDGLFRLKDKPLNEGNPEILINVLADYLDTIIYEQYKRVLNGQDYSVQGLEGLAVYSWMEIRRAINILIGQIYELKKYNKSLDIKDLVIPPLVYNRTHKVRNPGHNFSLSLLHSILDFSGITTGRNPHRPDRYQFSAASDIAQLEADSHPPVTSHQYQLKKELENTLQRYYDSGILKDIIDQYGSHSILDKITPFAVSVYGTSYACRISPPSVQQILFWMN